QSCTSLDTTPRIVGASSGGPMAQLGRIARPVTERRVSLPTTALRVQGGLVRSLPRRYSMLTQFLADAGAWVVGLAFAAVCRYDFAIGKVDFERLGAFAVVAVALQALAGCACGLYTGRWRFGSFDELRALIRAVSSVTVFLFVFELVAGESRLVPLSAPLA